MIDDDTLGITIAAGAKRLGCTQKTIRDYEAWGLIHSTRSKGGLRRLKPSTVARLEFILELKAYFFTIREIKALLDDPWISRNLRLPPQLAQERLTLLLEQRRLLDLRIEALNRIAGQRDGK